jgi:AcrR family transcriptional regulator
MPDDPFTRAGRVRANSGQRRARQKAEVREALLRAASELFLERGLVGFSLRVVAERVGYSATTVYLYFDNKDDLLFAVSLDGFEQFGRALQSAYESSDDPVERIGAIGRAYVRFGVTHPAHYRLMFMERGEFLLRENPRDQKPTVDSFGVLVRAVHEAQAAGRLRMDDPMALVYTLWAGVHGLVALTLCVPVMDEGDLEARTEALLSVLHSGFAAETR